MICCDVAAPQCTGGDARLVGGASTASGRLEVCSQQHGVWGTVCDNLFDTTEANIVCRQLGFRKYCSAVF